MNFANGHMLTSIAARIAATLPRATGSDWGFSRPPVLAMVHVFKVGLCSTYVSCFDVITSHMPKRCYSGYGEPSIELNHLVLSIRHDATANRTALSE